MATIKSILGSALIAFVLIAGIGFPLASIYYVEQWFGSYVAIGWTFFMFFIFCMLLELPAIIQMKADEERAKRRKEEAMKRIG